MADENRKSRGFLSRLLHDRRGNTLAMAGAALVPIAGMIGSGLDMARAYMAEAKLQNACDAGALAARRTMEGADFTSDVEEEGERFFDFNFPASTMSAENVTRTVAQDDDSDTTVVVTASADIPTTIMSLFGKDTIPITVTCNADNDYGNNDIMVVLDVTGSMNCAPGVSGSCGNTEQPGSKASRLRAGAQGLYNALAGASNTRTRFGLMPYSVTVNVGRRLLNRDILKSTYHYQCDGTDWYYGTEYCSGGKSLSPVHIDDTQWADSNANLGIRNWRQSGAACVEERPSSGNSANPIVIGTSVSQDDIDARAANGNDTARQWGRYDPERVVTDSPWYSLSTASGACPAEAVKLRTFGSQNAFNNAVASATANLRGNTYHDVGMIWAARFLSSTGIFASDNPTEWDGVPVAKHIVYLTDGELVVNGSTYSTYGIESAYDRLQGSGSQPAQHIARFHAACSRAKSMGMTIWVIALDVGSTGDISPCATSGDHFFTSDGSDLEEVFARIGQGIGRLRLTQ
ncbi:MAG: TadE/TadG family type IV pilus assembly protein [Parasphingopyxis sp.]|nr:pilus assembly protein [Sphingomonadales bacterium]